jgi:hypothetical protein
VQMFTRLAEPAYHPRHSEVPHMQLMGAVLPGLNS